jgi:sugar-phosphatase
VRAAPAPRGLLLDLDGTLVLSERVHRLTWQRFFDDWGLDVDEREYETTYKGRRAVDVLSTVRGPWSGADLGAVSARMSAHARTLGDTLEVVAGAAELVREAACEAMPVAVVTSAGRSWAEEVLGRVLGVRELVRHLVTADDVAAGKPAPEGYLRGCRLLGVDPAACTGVEDSVSGVRALVAAGVGRIVGITTTSAPADLRAAGAQRIVGDLRDPAVLRPPPAAQL